jgi:hypothetical protein
MEAATVKAASMEAATVETAIVETATVQTATIKAASMATATVKAHSISVKPAAPAATMRQPGRVRLAQRGNEQQSSCSSSQSPAHFGLNSFFT